MLYIDFDGVILDTEELIFCDWQKLVEDGRYTKAQKANYIKDRDWEFIIRNSPIINDAIYYLNNMDPISSTILTKVHSLDNEGYQKIKFLRENGVRQNIILVPYNISKTKVVDPTGNILIDDSIKNLLEWEACNGISLFFDKKENNIDTWNIENTHGFQRVKKLNDYRGV